MHIDDSRPFGPARSEHFLGGKAYQPVWKNDLIETWKEQCRNGTLVGNYGVEETNELFKGLQHAPGIKNGRVLVIGSMTPWVEACAWAAGASSVVTLEYGSIESQHAQISSFTPDKMRVAYLEGSLQLFDTIVTFSSLEHSGLGRYGDRLNPWGDLQTMARAWCVSKPGAGLVVGVPGPEFDLKYPSGDIILYNLHRINGPIMYSHLSWNRGKI